MKDMIRNITLSISALLLCLTNSFAEESIGYSIALFDATAGFSILKDLRDDGFFNSLSAQLRYLASNQEISLTSGTITLTSSLTGSSGNETANFALLGIDGGNHHYRISWQLERGSGITEDALLRMLNLAINSGNCTITDAFLEGIASQSDVQAFTVSYASDESESTITGYTATIEIGPSSRHYFWRTTAELVVLNSFGLINYFVNKDANMVDWEYQPNWEGFKRKITDGWCLDTNNFRTNSLYHIYAGIIYYQTARSNNYGPLASFIWCFAGSTFWEYIGEYREQVSTNDQIFTPMGGVIFGEGLRQLGLYAERSMRPGILRGLVCFILDPMRIVNRQLDRWIGDSFTFNVSFINAAHTIITETILERTR